MDNPRFLRRTLGPEPQTMDKEQLAKLVQLVQGQKDLATLGVTGPVQQASPSGGDPGPSLLARLAALFHRDREPPTGPTTSIGIRG